MKSPSLYNNRSLHNMSIFFKWRKQEINQTRWSLSPLRHQSSKSSHTDRYLRVYRICAQDCQTSCCYSSPRLIRSMVFPFYIALPLCFRSSCVFCFALVSPSPWKKSNRFHIINNSDSAGENGLRVKVN